MPDLVTRRQALVGTAVIGLVGAAGLVTACSSSDAPDGSATSAAPSDQPDPAIVGEQQLIASYDAVIAAYPALAPALTAIRQQHVDHLTALGGSEAPPASPPSAAAPTAKAAVGTLIDAERSAMRERISACVDETAPERARVLAFIAASEGSHIPELKRVTT